MTLIDKAEQKLQRLDDLLTDLEENPSLPHDAYLTLIKIKNEIAPDGHTLAYWFSVSSNPLQTLSKSIVFFKLHGGYDEEYSLQFLNKVPLLVQQGTESVLKRVLSFLQHTASPTHPKVLLEDLEQSSRWGERLTAMLEPILEEFPGTLTLDKELPTQESHFNESERAVLTHLRENAASEASPKVLTFLEKLLGILKERAKTFTQASWPPDAVVMPSGHGSSLQTLTLRQIRSGPAFVSWNRYAVKGLFYDIRRQEGVVRNVSISFLPGHGQVSGPQLTDEAMQAVVSAREAAITCLDQEFGQTVSRNHASKDMLVEITEGSKEIMCEGSSLGLAVAMAILSHATGQSPSNLSGGSFAVTGQVLLDPSGKAKIAQVNRETLKEKIEAACKEGNIQRIIIPYENRGDCPSSSQIVPVRTLNELIDILFPFEPMPALPLGISAEQALLAARKIVIRQQSWYLGTPHLFLGLLEVPHGFARNALERANANIPALQEKLTAAISPRKPARRIPVTRRCLDNFFQAATLAQKEQSAFIEDGHLLAVILKSKSGVTADILRQQGIEPSALA